MNVYRRIWRLLPTAVKAAVLRRVARRGLDAVHTVITFAADGVDSRIIFDAAYRAVSRQAFLEGWATLREWLGSTATDKDEQVFEAARAAADRHRGSVN